MVYRLADHNSIAQEILTEIRHVEKQRDRRHFRDNLRKLGMLLGFELSKKLKYDMVKVETPLGIAVSKKLKQEIVLATVLRAGLPMHRGLLELFPQAGNAFVSAYRKHHKDGTFEIELQYSTCPDIEGKTLIIADAMLATGSSMEKSLEELLQSGKPAELHIVTAIASTEGINHIKRVFRKAHIWTGDIDEELTARYYIVPGLGDAGDLAFGEKLQE